LLLRTGRAAGTARATGTTAGSTHAATHRGVGVVAEATDIGRLADHLAFYRLEQLGAARFGGQVDLRVQGIELEHVVVVARAVGCTRAGIGGAAAHAAAGRTVGQLALF